MPGINLITNKKSNPVIKFKNIPFRIDRQSLVEIHAQIYC